MRTNPNNKKPTDDCYWVSAAEVPERIIDLKEYGVDPFLLLTSRLALFALDPKMSIEVSLGGHPKAAIRYHFKSGHRE
jgi:hypothetical protein